MTDIITLSGAESKKIETCPFVVLPVGSLEYHGPHAALGTDTTLAVGFAREVAAAFGALLLPAISYSFAPRITSVHQGTISIPPDTFMTYLFEVMRALVKSGASRILVLNGHSENQYSIRLAAEQLALQAPASSVLYVNWWKLVDHPEPLEDPLFSEAGGHGHGGPLEISAAAAFDEAGVNPQAGQNIPFEALWWKVAGQIVGAGQAPEGFRGYHGNVDEINRDKGRKLVDHVMKGLSRLVEEWLERASRA